jgi:hypothetical protein
VIPPGEPTDDGEDMDLAALIDAMLALSPAECLAALDRDTELIEQANRAG